MVIVTITAGEMVGYISIGVAFIAIVLFVLYCFIASCYNYIKHIVKGDGKNGKNKETSEHK